MANQTIDNGALADFSVSGKTLTGSHLLQDINLVTGTEGGAKADLAKAEDAAHSSGDFGIMALGVRKDTAAALAGTDGDYAPFLVDANGRMHVNVGAALAAGRNTDAVAAGLMGDVIMDNLTPRAPQWASISAASAGSQSLIAAAGAGLRIRVHALMLVAAAAVTVQFLDNVTALSGVISLDVKAGFVLPFNPLGWTRGSVNTQMNISLGTAVQVSGMLVWTPTA